MKEKKLYILWEKVLFWLSPKLSSFSALVATGRELLARAGTSRNLCGFPGGLASLIMAEEGLRNLLSVRTRIYELTKDLNSLDSDMEVLIISLEASLSRLGRNSAWRRVIFSLVADIKDWVTGFRSVKEMVISLREQECEVSLPAQCTLCLKYFDPKSGGDDTYTSCCGI